VKGIAFSERSPSQTSSPVKSASRRAIECLSRRFKVRSNPDLEFMGALPFRPPPARVFPGAFDKAEGVRRRGQGVFHPPKDPSGSQRPKATISSARAGVSATA